MGTFTAKKILIIDDDKDIHETISYALELEGYETVVAKNGQVAFDYLNSQIELPDLVILDYWMPVMNGEEFHQKIRKVPRLANIPIIMISAAGGNLVEVMKHCETEGYMAKPMDIDTVLKMTKYFTNSHHLNPYI